MRSMIARLCRLFSPGRFAPILLLLGIPPASRALTLQDDFSELQAGPLPLSWLEKRWKTHADNGVRENRVSVLQEDGNSFIRVSYPQGQIGSRASGASWRSPLPPSDEATAEYRVRFEPDFHWTSGGKLPGLSGGTGATGGRPNPDGLTARYMWKPGGRLILYLYHSEQRGRYGDGIRLDHALLRPGEWHTLRQRIKLNTPGQPDGELQVWIDGKLAFNRTDMRWRSADQTWQINRFYFSTFHGGASDDYRPDRDNHIDFDDFVITTVDPPPLSASSAQPHNHPTSATQPAAL
ncbi:hypothetical protein OPIT5_15560 [Opitutaceae bacterium TAV5]|nr:hypothetical protein OPIT5_15560 [Opitutaceae bacterium TAV5]